MLRNVVGRVYLLVSIRDTDTGGNKMSLGIYGDGGSMMGSGIYQEDYSGIFYCADCDDEYTLDGTTDDYGYNATAECPDCGKELEKELPTRDEVEADYWADYDPEK
jgi:hypothetical protein